MLSCCSTRFTFMEEQSCFKITLIGAIITIECSIKITEIRECKTMSHSPDIPIRGQNFSVGLPDVGKDVIWWRCSHTASGSTIWESTILENNWTLPRNLQTPCNQIIALYVDTVYKLLHACIRKRAQKFRTAQCVEEREREKHRKGRERKGKEGRKEEGIKEGRRWSRKPKAHKWEWNTFMMMEIN